MVRDSTTIGSGGGISASGGQTMAAGGETQPEDKALQADERETSHRHVEFERSRLPEPWLRGTLTEVDAVRRQVLHALELTGEDAARWCASLSNAELHHRPFGLASVAFHLRHIAGSLDRLLTYAEGNVLTAAQLTSLRLESDAPPPPAAAENGPIESMVDYPESAELHPLLVQLRRALDSSESRILLISPTSFEQIRFVGRALLPSTVGGLLVHCAEHTQRHSGQAIVTAKVVRAMRPAEHSSP